MEYGGDGRISEERDGRRGEAGTGDGGGVCIVYHQKGQHKSGSGGRLVPLAGDDSGGCAVRTGSGSENRGDHGD